MAAECIVIIISHRLYLFPEMDQVIWMEQGHAAVGTHETIKSEYEEYAKHYEAQTTNAEKEAQTTGAETEAQPGEQNAKAETGKEGAR